MILYIYDTSTNKDIMKVRLLVFFGAQWEYIYMASFLTLR